MFIYLLSCDYYMYVHMHIDDHSHLTVCSLENYKSDTPSSLSPKGFDVHSVQGYVQK